MNTTYPYLCFKSKLKVFFLLARVELVLELALGRLQLGICLVAEIVDNDLVGELWIVIYKLLIYFVKKQTL